MSGFYNNLKIGQKVYVHKSNILSTLVEFEVVKITKTSVTVKSGLDNELKFTLRGNLYGSPYSSIYLTTYTEKDYKDEIDKKNLNKSIVDSKTNLIGVINQLPNNIDSIKLIEKINELIKDNS